MYCFPGLENEFTAKSLWGMSMHLSWVRYSAAYRKYGKITARKHVNQIGNEQNKYFSRHYFT